MLQWRCAHLVTAYVDALMDHGWRLGRSCHLLADSLDELHAFASQVGMRRSWFQSTSLPHYDLTAGGRARAIKMGAREVDRSFVVQRIRAARAAMEVKNTRTKDKE